MKALPKRKGNRHFAVQLHALRHCLNESPSQKEGKWSRADGQCFPIWSLNESPSQKEGKCPPRTGWVASPPASMKALPKRKGNIQSEPSRSRHHRLNESPSEKEGKLMSFCVRLWTLTSLNESPSEKEGKYSTNRRFSQIGQPSMKVPPKRKGNDFDLFVVGFGLFPSMKVPPKRKGNILARRLRTLPPPFPQ